MRLKYWKYSLILNVAEICVGQKSDTNINHFFWIKISRTPPAWNYFVTFKQPEHNNFNILQQKGNHMKSSNLKWKQAGYSKSKIADICSK